MGSVLTKLLWWRAADVEDLNKPKLVFITRRDPRYDDYWLLNSFEVLPPPNTNTSPQPPEDAENDGL
jgi:hypothetical protein